MKLLLQRLDRSNLSSEVTIRNTFRNCPGFFVPGIRHMRNPCELVVDLPGSKGAGRASVQKNSRQNGAKLRKIAGPRQGAEAGGSLWVERGVCYPGQFRKIRQHRLRDLLHILRPVRRHLRRG